MQPNNPPSAEEWRMISDHLQTVFRKVTSGQQTLGDLRDYMQRMKDQNKTVVSPAWAPGPIITC